MRAYSLDLRQHAVAALADGTGKGEVAKVFGISVRTINRYLQQLGQGEGLAARPIPGRPRVIPPEQDEALTAQLEAEPTATLRQHCRRWHQTQGAWVSPAAMSRAIQRLGWTWEKRRWWPPSRTLPNGSSGVRPSATRIPSSSSSSTSRAPTWPYPPRYARAPRGERAPGSAPRNYGRTTTLVAALPPTGITAPMTLEGAMASDALVAYVDQVLLPTLQRGQLVICDNLSVHKRADIRARIEQAGCAFIFLPAYSPDFNPIEQAFSKLKAFLRRAEARTQEALDAAIKEALNTITAADARGWFAHAGYPLPGQP